ncbi:MAG: hypothetical protein CVU58_07870, partial [Deltaproteobacteria bacterium HGW-Deltaproteobacteria-16]
LTAQEPGLRDPEKALFLAQKAAAANRTPHVLDTLATAYWATGNREKALAIEEEALTRTKTHQAFYRSQMEKFRTTEYSSSTLFPEPGGNSDLP